MCEVCLVGCVCGWAGRMRAIGCVTTDVTCCGVRDAERQSDE